MTSSLTKKKFDNAKRQWPENNHILHLAQRSNCCTVLGPGRRAVLWVQGCPFRCPGCVAPETHPFHGGQDLDVVSLADELSRLSDIEGVTFSGGEPMAQAAVLVRLVDLIKNKRDLSFMSYTGYSLECLQNKGTPAQKSLLKRLDILIDGPYIAARHSNLRGRGSDNQQVHFLSPRYLNHVSIINDRGCWLEFENLTDGTFHWMGIPPKGFRRNFERNMHNRGIYLINMENNHE